MLNHKLNSYLTLTFTILFGLGCNPVGRTNQVKITEQGALEPVVFEVVGGEEKGEFLVGGEAVAFDIRVKNNSTESITNMDLFLDPLSSAAMKFMPNEEGKSESPGLGGNCKTVLESGKECIYRLEFQATFSGELSQKLNFRYKNLIRPGEESAEITMLAGEAASLIFEGEVINYNLGLLERKDPAVYNTFLKVMNVGGLSARNIIFSKLDNTASQPFSILENNCGEEIKKGESCTLEVSYTSKNYGIDAPDGDVDLGYSSTLRFDYIRDPKGGASALSGYFSANSKRIRGIIQEKGPTAFFFENLTVGRRASITAKVANDGDRSAILHHLDIYDKSNNHLARCSSFDGDTLLNCQDPIATGKGEANLTLAQLPLTIKDSNNCLIDYDDTSYTRLSDGSLSVPNLKQIAGKTGDLPGEVCLFDLTFQPSVTYTTSGNINNYEFIFVYDSTYKNTIDMVNTASDIQSKFAEVAQEKLETLQETVPTATMADVDIESIKLGYWSIGDAQWKSAAKLSVSNYIYANNSINSEPESTDKDFYFDLGRIALISEDKYSEKLQIYFENSGGTVADIVSIKDGGSPQFEFDIEPPVNANDINTYYRNALPISCGTLSENGGACNLDMKLVPLALSSETEENNAMFDIQNGYPHNYKRFIVEYKDGSHFLDDGTPAPNKFLQVYTRAILVKKGYLVYESLTGAGDDNYIVGNGTDLFFLKLKNAGTGGIPYISTKTGFDLKKPTSDDSMFPYEFVDRPGTAGHGGADKDCYDFLVREETAPAPVGGPAPSILGAGENCTLAVKVNFRQNDVSDQGDYAEGDSVDLRDWYRPFWSEIDGSIELWEKPRYVGYQLKDVPTSFVFYDGDFSADPLDANFNGEYGNKFSIAGPNSGRYTVSFNHSRRARLYPMNPYPSITGILCRDTFTVPDIGPASGEWGNTRSGTTVPEKCYSIAKWKMSEEAYFTNYAQTKIKSEHNGYDYIYYAGAWNVGDSYDLSFKIVKNNGGSGGVNIIGSPALTNNESGALVMNSTFGSTLNGEKIINLTFTPTEERSYEEELEITYGDKTNILTDETSLTYSENQSIFRIKIIADGVENFGLPVMTVQDYEVTYDPDAADPNDAISEDTLDGAPYSFPLFYHETDPNTTLLFSAIRSADPSTQVFDKKELIFTNTNATDLKNFSFNIKEFVGSSTFKNTLAGAGYSVNNNTCVNVTLAQGQSCSVIIKFAPILATPSARNMTVSLTYEVIDNVYQQHNTLLRFEARDPAILTSPNTSDATIIDSSGNFVPNSNILSVKNFGFGHPIITTFPKTEVAHPQIEIRNTSSEKASFLRQWEIHASDTIDNFPTIGAYIEIYNQGDISVEASRGCFFGDDEALLIDEDTKGFNSSTTAKCYLRPYVNFDGADINKQIDPADFNFKLYFYNNKRASSDFMAFHFEGFVEGNRIPHNGDKEIIDVVSMDDGSISFKWEPIDDSGSGAWGNIDGYRVFYDQSQTVLNDVFTNEIQYEDTTNLSDPNILISGLANGSYYYFKIMALRTAPDTGLQYISETNMGVKSAIIPLFDYFYDYDEGVMISKNISSSLDGFGTKTEAVNACASETVTIIKNGSPIPLNLKLINSNIYSIINQDSENSNYPYDGVPHWMADNTVDVSGLPAFTPFDCSQQSGTDGDKTFYQKSCNDCSCNNLSLFIGGDGIDLPFGAIVYAEGADYDAAIRCYLQQ